jgi:hypothetical protein
MGWHAFCIVDCRYRVPNHPWISASSWPLRTEPRNVAGRRSVRNFACLELVRSPHGMCKEVTKFRPVQEGTCLVDVGGSNSCSHTRGRCRAIPDLSFYSTGYDSGSGRVSLVGHYHFIDGSNWSGSTRASCCVAGLVFVGWRK